MLENEIEKKSEKLREYETQLRRMKALEEENRLLNDKLNETTEVFESQMVEKDQIIREQVEQLQEQLTLMQHFEEDIQRLEGHITDLNDQLHQENQDINYLQEQLKTKEAEIQSAKHKRDQSTTAMIFKYQSTRALDSPKPRSTSGTGKQMNFSGDQFENYTAWQAMGANSLTLKSVDIDQWVCYVTLYMYCFGCVCVCVCVV